MNLIYGKNKVVFIFMHNHAGIEFNDGFGGESKIILKYII